MSKSSFTLIRKSFIPVVIICLLAIFFMLWWRGQSYAQNTSVQEPQRGMTAMIENLKRDGMQFPTYELTQREMPLSLSIQQDVLSRGEVFELNDSTASVLVAGINQTLALRLPDPLNKDSSVELELTMVDILAEGFRVTTASSNGQPVEFQSGKHYRGTVKGVPGSIAAISASENEVSGIFSTPEKGNFVLGKLGGDNPGNHHILYPSADLKIDRTYKCATKDNDANITVEEITDTQTASVGGCIKIFIEVDDDIFTARGSVANTINHVQSLFNQSATLFANDGISVKLSEMFVWDRRSPYTGINSARMLTEFQNHRNSFNADLGQLISMRAGGGRAASVNGFCNSNIDNQQSYSFVENNFNNVPTYSLSVENFTHELGHLMGSLHTHACVWNGNNTAIDGCETVEGNCSNPGLPSPNSGTIMSYCDLVDGVGINFSLGFGPQPRALIRNRINSAACINGCGEGCNYLISPTSKSFGSGGGSSSASVTVTNCPWTAYSSHSWLKITSRPNGYGNGTISYTVTANTSASARTGYISVGEKLLTITQEGYVPQLIKNGGFESGQSPWGFWNYAFRSTGTVPHSGSAYAIISDGNNESGSIYQDITIPANGSPNLSFWLSISSEEITGATAYDKLHVQIRNTSNQVLTTLAVFSNLDEGNESYVLRGNYNLGAYAGKTVRITLLVRNDQSYPTKFRVDDVSIR